MLKKLTLAFLVTTVSVFATDIEGLQVDVKPSQQTVEWKTGHTESGRRGLKKITKVEVWQGPKVSQTLTLTWNEQGSVDVKTAQITLSYLTNMNQFWTPDNNLTQVNEQTVIGATIVDVAAKTAEWKLQAETLGADLGYSDAARTQLKTFAHIAIDAIASQLQPTTMQYKGNSRSEKIWNEAKRIGDQSTDAWKEIVGQAEELAQEII
ncbi:MAG: hypothetical protein KF798_03460 [Candidatus Paracaedibacteraceae bacterium]|nr:hypothetical protein [Candidatus Paracaedibacteraceae bacterium]